MRRGLQTVVVGVLFGLGLATPIGGTPASGTPAAAVVRGPSPIEATVAVSGRQADGSPTLVMTVTNRAEQACRLAAIPDGTVQAIRVRRDGAEVTSSFFDVAYFASYQGKLLDSLREVVPGQGLSFPITSNGALRTVSPVPGGGGIGAFWRVDQPGRYAVAVEYRVPGTAGGACAGSSGLVSVEFSVGDTDDGGFVWLWVAGAAGIALVLVLIMVIRSRRRRAVAMALALFAVVASMQVVQPRQATATVKAANGDPALQAAIDGCLNGYRAGDGRHPGGGMDPAGIMQYIDGPYPVLVKAVVGAANVQTDHNPKGNNPKGSDVSWDPNDRARIPGDTIANDPCASLYHELVHAADNSNGIDGNHDCGHPMYRTGNMAFGPAMKEVRATRAENAYRAMRSGLSARTTYGDDKHSWALPPGTAADWESVRKDCDQSGPAPKRDPNKPDKSRFARGGSNGDPHLVTIDGQRQSFQAVGEFVLAASGSAFEVQVRQSAFEGSRDVAVNSAFGLRVGADRVELAQVDGTLAITLNGQPKSITGPTRLPGGGEITSVADGYSDGYTVRWPDGTEVDIMTIGRWGLFILLYPADSLKGTVKGLLGNFDDNPANDFMVDGKPLPAQPSHEQLYGAFADQWRVTASNSLLNYPPGKDTTAFTDKSFPDKVITIADLDPSRRDSAREVCVNFGITDPQAQEECVLDLVLTGQPAFAASAAHAAMVFPAALRTEDRKGAVRDGQVVSGRIDKPGEVHSYPLELGDATVFRLTGVSGELVDRGEFDPELAGPSGADSPGFTMTGNYQYRVVKGGSYTLNVLSRGNLAGSYTFRVVTAKERRIPAAVGQRITGRLDIPGRVDLYEIQSTSQVRLTPTDGTGCDFEMGFAEDVAPQRAYTLHTPCLGVDVGTLEPGKRYVLAVWSAEGATGDYSFRLAT